MSALVSILRLIFRDRPRIGLIVLGLSCGATLGPGDRMVPMFRPIAWVAALVFAAFTGGIHGQTLSQVEAEPVVIRPQWPSDTLT